MKGSYSLIKIKTMETKFKKLLLTLCGIVLSFTLFAQQQPTVITVVNQDDGLAACCVAILTDQGEELVLDIVGSVSIGGLNGKVIQINFLVPEGLVFVNSYKENDYYFVVILKNEIEEENNDNHLK